MKNTILTVSFDVSVNHQDDADLDDVQENVLNEIWENHNRNKTKSFPGGNYYITNGSHASKVTLEPEGTESVPFQIADADVDAAKNDPDRVVAEYNKQIWRGDSAIQVGKEYWDITCLIDQMSDKEVQQLMDNDYSTDGLVHDYSSHDGPHSVEVEAQARAYRDLTGE